MGSTRKITIARRRGADGLRGLDEGLLFDGQGLAPDEAGKARGKDQRQGQGHVAHPGAEHGDHGERQDQRWEGQPGVGAAHQQIVDPPAPVAGHQADHQGQHQGQADGHEGHLHGDAGPINEPGEHVAPEIVGAQQMGGAHRGVGGEKVLGVGVVGSNEGGEDGGHNDQDQPEDGQDHPRSGEEAAQTGVLVPPGTPRGQASRNGADLGHKHGHDTRTLGLRKP